MLYKPNAGFFSGFLHTQIFYKRNLFYTRNCSKTGMCSITGMCCTTGICSTTGRCSITGSIWYFRNPKEDPNRDPKGNYIVHKKCFICESGIFGFSGLLKNSPEKPCLSRPLSGRVRETWNLKISNLPCPGPAFTGFFLGFSGFR